MAEWLNILTMAKLAVGHYSWKHTMMTKGGRRIYLLDYSGVSKSFTPAR